MWAELDKENLHEECCKAEDWILNPCQNASRINLYERTVVLFWVMKNLIGHSMWEKQEMGGNEEQLVQWRSEMTDDLKWLNQKMDTILQGLGMQVLPAQPTLVNQ